MKSNIAREMEGYRLYNVVPALFEFIEDLTNWYIRLNRTRFWTEEMNEDKNAAYETLFTTLYELGLSMAPFAPFLSESIYQALRSLLKPEAQESVHLCNYPEAESSHIQPVLEQAVTRMQHIILLGRQKRNQQKIKTKYPLHSLTIIHKDRALLDEISKLEEYIQAELNIKKVDYSEEESRYINLFAKPNSPVLGKRFGKQFKDVKKRIESLTSETISNFQEEGRLDLDGEVFQQDDILVFREAREGTNALSDRFISIDLNCELDDDLISEGLAREVVNRIQKSRRDLGLNVVDRIKVGIAASEKLQTAIFAHQDYIRKETLASVLIEGVGEEPLHFDIDDHNLTLSIEKVE